MMRRILRRGVRASAVVLASAALALAPGLVAAQSQNGSDQVSAGTKQTEQGDAETSKSAGKTGQSAGAVGDRLHDSAKNFGEALLGGIKYAGRTIVNFFNDDKPKK